MWVLFYLVQKEFLQVLRNRAMLPILTVLPIVQLILLSNAASNEVKNVNVSIADRSQSSESRLLVHQLAASGRVTVVSTYPTALPALQDLQEGRADVVLNIDHRFETKLGRGAELQILANAISGQTAVVGSSYVGAIIQDFGRDFAQERRPPRIRIQTRNWFNPTLDYKVFMVPGILGELVTLLILVLTAMNIVREREVGTIEQINVTPIKKWQFIIGKLVPFLIIGLVLLSVGLLAGRLLFDIPMRGSLGLVFAYCFINLLVVLGAGLLISNFAETQQQAILIAFFFVIIFILMSGLFTPISSMPKWAQLLSWPNPVAHFVAVMRAVLVKGATAADILPHIAATLMMAVVFNLLAIVSFKKRS